MTWPCLPLNPTPKAFAAPANQSLTQGTEPIVERTTDDVLFKSSQQRQQQLVAEATAKSSKPAGAAALNRKRGRVRREDQALGEMLFAKEWILNDPTSHGGDGLGPVYNETSCVACHGLGGPGGAGPESKNVILVTASPSGCGPTQPLSQIHPGFLNLRSTVIHRFGTDPEYALWRRRFFDPNSEKVPKVQQPTGEEAIKARIRAIRQQSTLDRRMVSGFQLPATNGFALSVVERNTPALFGLGQIDEIPSDELVAVAAIQPPETRGRVSRTREGRVGRYGWKRRSRACMSSFGPRAPMNSAWKCPAIRKRGRHLSPLAKRKGST